MGLDMYLTAENYFSDWNPQQKQQSDAIKAIIETTFPVQNVVLKVAYWRKANAVHNWFVQECQGGVDDCRYAYVPKEKLEDLHKLACAALEKPATVGPEVLPTKGGFFFGGTDYDQGYVEDMQETKRQLEALFASPEWQSGYDFYYHSSW